MFVWLLCLSLHLAWVVARIDETKPVHCEIRVQACVDGTEDLGVGFIEVGADRLVSWRCVDESTRKVFIAAYVTGSCEYHTVLNFFEDTTTDYTVVFDSLLASYQMVPYGAHFLLVTGYAGYSFFQDYIGDNDGPTLYSTFLEDLHIELDEGGNVLSQGENATLVGVDLSEDDALIVVARKGFPDQGTVKLIVAAVGPRLVTYAVRAEPKEFCIAPLTPMDSITLDPRIYGQDDTFIQRTLDSTIEDVVIRPLGLHLVTSERIGCNDAEVVAWEFIPANPTTVYFSVVRVDSVLPRDLQDGITPEFLGTTQVVITDDMVTDELAVQYKCIRPNPIRHVQAGDQFLFYTATDEGVPEDTPLKRVYVPPYTNTRYPCSRQLTSAEAGIVHVFENDLGDIDQSFDFDEKVVMNIALKPILDTEFLYTCGCEGDTFCQQYGDAHMMCHDDQCVCNQGYAFNRAQNKCVYKHSAQEGTAFQSSQLGGLSENAASRALDEDTDTDVLTGTCAKTEAGADPWWLVDLGESLDVYSVQMKTLEPLDVYLELWALETDVAEIPDAVLYNSSYTDVVTTTGLATVEAIAVHGPMPWIIKTSDESDVKVLNTVLKDGETLYTFNNADVGLNFGSVGSNIGQISRIEDFGFFQSLDDTICMYYSDPNIQGVTLTAGQNCVDNVPANGKALIIYMEESSDGTGDFYIRNLDDRLAFALNSFTAGTKVVLGSDKTTFRFYLNDAARASSSETTLSSVLDASVGVLIVPTNDQTICLEVSVDDFIVVGSDCDTQFYLRKRFDDTLPKYSYSLKDWDGSADDTAPYLDLDLVDSTIKPCYEIVRTMHDASDVGAAFTFIDDSNYDPFLAVRDDDADITTDDTRVLMRSNVVGIHNFVVGVSSYFDGTNFEAENFTTCASFEGAPVNGRLFTLDCETPVTGRYVAVYMETSNVDEKIQLCDFSVSTLAGSHTPMGDVCYNDSDCDYLGDDRKLCDLDLHTDVDKGRCACMIGYIYHTVSQLCIDVDECVNSPSICEAEDAGEDGVEDGACVNTVGSYYCNCSEGFHPYHENLVGTYCVDIDETLENNCGCEGNCTNLAVDADGQKYECSCAEGYVLAQDAHGCLDVDECEEDYCGDRYTSYCGSNDCSATMAPADCRNYPGTYECLCPRGFEHGQAGACTNIDECLEPRSGPAASQAGCESECTDRNPRLDSGLLFECSCDGMVGFTLATNHLTCVDFDECTQPPCNYVLDLVHTETLGTNLLESGSCVNVVGSFFCACREGYRWDAGINVCYDINECLESHECEQVCVNLDGDYSCECDEGYVLALNNHSCEDIDECSGVNECDNYPLEADMVLGTCVNTLGGFHCDCSAGYEWTCSDRDSCTLDACFDIDECDRDTDFCQYDCENRYVRTAGVPFVCSCPDGWQLAQDSRTCIDIDECAAANICQREIMAECENSIGSFVCRCSIGYEFDLDQSKCNDVNECDVDNGGCAGTCDNTVGSFGCRCPPGYVLDPNGRACIDINECLLTPCEHHCYNNPGSFYCTCDVGYLPDPVDQLTCRDIDECSLKNGGCMQICTNQNGSSVCSCTEGYSLMADQASCDVKDECFNPLDNDCSHICINTFSGYDCDCRKGYKLNADKLTCGDLNECDTFNGGCEQECANTIGSYFCRCPLGYTVGLNSKICHDNDECQANNGGCDQICVNTPGSFLCLCDGGQQVGDDGFKCVGQNFIRMRTKIAYDWHPSFGDLDSLGFKSLQASLDYNFRTICGGVAVSNSYGSVECRVVGPFTQGSVIFDLIVLTASPLSEGDRSVLSYAIKESLDENENYLVINGTSVPIEGKPQFIYTAPGGSGGKELVWTVDSLCAYYEETSYCLNGGSCEVDRGYPQCKCLEGYDGDRCNKASDDDMTDTEIALISSVAVLGVAVILLMFVSCWLCFKNIGRPDNVQVDEEPVPGDEKSAFEGRMPYFAPSYWPSYGNYN